MSNVINMSGQPRASGLEDSDRVNPELVEGLEELLAAARAGLLTGGFYVFTTSMGDQLTAVYARDVSGVELLGLAALGTETVNEFVRG